MIILRRQQKMRKRKFKDFIEQEKTVKKALPYGEETGKDFISKISLSLRESGYNIGKGTVLIIFIAYLLIFFLFGYNSLGPMFFNIQKGVTVEDIVTNPELSWVKENLISAGIESANVLGSFTYSLNKNEELEKYFKDNSVEENIDNIKKIVQESAYQSIEKTLGLKRDSIPPFDLDVLSIYRSIDSKKTDKKASFISTVSAQFKEYISLSPFDKILVEKANAMKQLFLFKLSFGLIMVFQGYLIFLAFIRKPLEEMSLNRLKLQIPTWLQIMTNSIQAGNSLSQALQFSRERIRSAPLSYILDEVTARYETYKNLEQALTPFNKWIEKIPELKNVVSSLVIQEQKGGNLIPVLYALTNLFNKKTLVLQKIESIASEATGQLKIIFIMFFGIILMSELFMKSFRSPLSPAYMFFSRGGNLPGFLYMTFMHLLILFLSFVLYKAGEVVVQNEMKF
jgi:hypothetical protein